MNKNIATFEQWAVLGKDKGMEQGHQSAVSHMLKMIFNEYENKNQKYSIIDLGCGNGWVVRKFKTHALCKYAHGLDGAKTMIHKAKKYDPSGTYFHEDMNTWTPTQKYDVVFCPNH